MNKLELYKINLDDAKKLMEICRYDKEAYNKALNDYHKWLDKYNIAWLRADGSEAFKESADQYEKVISLNDQYGIDYMRDWTYEIRSNHKAVEFEDLDL